MTETPWRPIKTAPKPRSSGDKVIRIDILAKVWIRESDSFKYKRFTDCYWKLYENNVQNNWHGVDETYHAVAWMPVPELPKEWPLPDSSEADFEDRPKAGS
jgi:hypothetical protein